MNATPSAGRRRATAETMAAAQRSISVSEFFTKNRHLLGFDNPRKALLTTVKEAVDNSLDACEEAGIVPELWIHIEATTPGRYKVAIQDNGPGIVKKQIPLIFGKLLYGSKFHRLRMSRGQQGIGISAAGMYGQLTTGKPVRIVSKTAPRKPAHYFEIQINTKTNSPEILNGRGEGEDIPPAQKGVEYIERKGIEWVTNYDPPTEGGVGKEIASGTRVTIELEGIYKRGKGSVDEFLEQTSIANPHVTIHFVDPEGVATVWQRSTEQLPPEPKEIKPHPYGVEFGRLVTMLKESPPTMTVAQFLTHSFSRVGSGVARRICQQAKIATRSTVRKIGRSEADQLFAAMSQTRIPAPSTDCISAIGEPLLIKGLHAVVPGEFYAAATRPPAVYRGNPFQVEVSLAYGGAAATRKVTREELNSLLDETDTRTVRQFLLNSFDGLGSEGVEKIVAAAKLGARQAPARLKAAERQALFEAMRETSLHDEQTMQVLRFANRVPLMFKQRDCAITQAIIGTNWRPYGLAQSRGSLPTGPVTVLVHLASVWVPFTSESKEAIAGYQEIEREIRLALQAVGRRLGIFLRRRQSIRAEGERRNIFLRYLGEVATAVSDINGTSRQALYDNLLAVARRKTKEADTRLDDRGRACDDEDELRGDNVLVVDSKSNGAAHNGQPAAAPRSARGGLRHG